MSNYIEVRFKLKTEDFTVYANEINNTGLPSPTAQIKAEVVKQANIKRELNINSQKRSNHNGHN
ncbi:hypothetical protein ACRBU7_03990 [Priestia aryabhattai]|uniref:hypothetical protein n=1 Tax=Priestia aryabhattai TaxID=412384 RepID=UPI003D7FFCEF